MPWSFRCPLSAHTETRAKRPKKTTEIQLEVLMRTILPGADARRGRSAAEVGIRTNRQTSASAAMSARICRDPDASGAILDALAECDHAPGRSLSHPGQGHADRAQRWLHRHAVSVNPPTSENPAGYHRLIGGGVELGETHRDAIVREVDEELGATIRDLSLLTAVESIFHIDGTSVTKSCFSTWVTLIRRLP